MRRETRTASLLLGVACCGAVANGQSTTPMLDPLVFLRQYGEFGKSDLAKVARGEAVAKSLDADSAEVAICAAVRLAVPVSFYLAGFRAIESFKRGENVRQVGRFGSPPALSDLASLTLDPGDVSDLKTCRPGDCDMKLDDAGVERVRAAVQRGDAAGPVVDAFKRHLADYAARYLDRGDAALMAYHDHDKPSPVADELRKILERSAFVPREMPAMSVALNGFRGGVPEGMESFTYWSKEEVGPKAVISMTHVLIGSVHDRVSVTASKQIYASHYLTASLGVTLLFDTSADSGHPQTILIYVNRSRADAFGGLLGSFKRSVARSRARSGAERMLRQLALRLEREFRAGAPRPGDSIGR